MEADRTAVLSLRNSWDGIRVLLNDMLINWDNGAAYKNFKVKRVRLAEQLYDLRAAVNSRWYYPAELTRLLESLTKVWARANKQLDQVNAAVENPDFQPVRDMVQSKPGLQRLNHLWTELLESDTGEARRSAYLIQQLISEVEFFPIYSGTVERLFEVLVARADEVHDAITKIEAAFRVVFFLSFLGTCLWLASRFTRSLSNPIIVVTRRLYEFAGLTGGPRTAKTRAKGSENDELTLLDRSVEQVISHYTELSRRAGQLAQGDVSDDTLRFPREGVVGRSLDEIADYLRELAHTSAWIRDGEYGLQIKERSDRDVLTHNFNVMSAVIREKIATLRSMFEAVDEAVAVIDEKGTVLEANSQLYRLIGTKHPDSKSAAFIASSVVPRLIAAAEGAPFSQARSNIQTKLTNERGRDIPVRINSRPLPGSERSGAQCMFLIVDESWRARAKREKERLKSQAVLAELRALRAQINPHFLFNTLNTIAYLIETDREAAVGTVEQLADLFRYTLTATKKERVSLSDEIEHIRRFLDIERIRRGENLHVAYEIDEALYEQPIPPMLLQPLVENAVRYGGDELGAVRLTVAAKKEGESMLIEIADRGISEVETETLLNSSGTGIRNVYTRFATIFGYPLTFRKNDPHGLVVSMRMPALHA